MGCSQQQQQNTQILLWITWDNLVVRAILETEKMVAEMITLMWTEKLPILKKLLFSVYFGVCVCLCACAYTQINH